MILQQGTPARVWGACSPAGAPLRLLLNRAPAASAVCGPAGDWLATLPPQPTRWAALLRVEATGSGAGSESVVKFGHVLLCSGQSNTQMPLQGVNGTGFGSANGTEEMLAAGAFTGKLSLLSLETPFPIPTSPPWNGSSCPGWPPANASPACTRPEWNAVSPGPAGTVRGFSALCWYTGKALFLALRGATPVGLIAGSVGGSPIALWLPRGVQGTVCPADAPVCDNAEGLKDSMFYDALIAPFAPLAIGGIVWDQAERDVHCFAPATTKTAGYPCNLRALVNSWRQAFQSPTAAFAAVQLPGYIGDCDLNNAAQPLATYAWCVPGVFNMRLAQAEGVRGLANASIVPTYDLSCPFGVNTELCPWGSVHNLWKEGVGARVAAQLLAAMEPATFPRTAGPHALSASAAPAGAQGAWKVTVHFDGAPLALRGTQHCAACCGGGVGDFDVSDGAAWVNATGVVLGGASGEVAFTVEGVSSPARVRYTGNQGFPQCAVVGSGGLPAEPFQIEITA